MLRKALVISTTLWFLEGLGWPPAIVVDAPRRLMSRAGSGEPNYFPATFFLPPEDIARLGSRRIDLMNSARRNLRADQSSSMATIRTPSKPAAPSALQPESRLKSHL